MHCTVCLIELEAVLDKRGMMLLAYITADFYVTKLNPDL